MSGRQKIVIIGGGVAGLTAGVYGQLKGYETEIIEMHTVPGGQCTAWERNGYRFDYCLHWLVGSSQGVFNEIWRETGVLNDEVKVVDHDIFTRIVFEDGTDFLVYTNIDQWERYLVGLAPEDAAAIGMMCSEWRKISFLDSFVNPPGLRSLKEYVKTIGKMLPSINIFMKYLKMNLRDYFNGKGFRSSRLMRGLESIFPQEDFSALAFLMTIGWMNQKNAGYLIGGSLPMATRMASTYRAVGGKLTLGKRVTKILVENNTAVGVILADGTTIGADYVISAADGHGTLFEMLEGKYVTRELDEAYKTWPLFEPLVQVSFGIDIELETECHNTEYVTSGQNIGSTPINGYSVMNYAFDPTMAPAGKTSIVMRFESPWPLWEAMGEAEYRAEKERIKQDAVALMESLYPGFASHIEVIDVATPRTDVRYTGVWKGAYEGFLPCAKNIAKRQNLSLPGLSRFYMCGQWLFPGGGLPPSAQSGRWAIQLICRDSRKKFRSCKTI